MLKVLVLVALWCACQAQEAKDVEGLKKTVNSLARQMMLQQLFVEERIRSDGDSGIKQTRHSRDGTKSYFSTSFTDSRIAAIHDHTNNIRTVGMGEFIAVLNGVEFRTRHNDYRLLMPSKTKKTFHSVDPIPFPDVPPAVLAKKTVNEQVIEMREWFKAWKNQNFKVRDYRKFFKPVMCYLEGAWTKSSKSINEPFFSDRHFIDASSWFDLQEKIRFTSYTGRKSNAENYAYLPVKIMNMMNGTIPEFAQWNYRIVCSPVNKDIPLKRLRVVDDLAARVSNNKKTMKEHSESRAARFQINPFPYPNWPKTDRPIKRGFVDSIMEEIPGKDNFGANLVDDSFGLTSATFTNVSVPLNAAYYHRWFRVMRRDAMGVNVRARGYADNNVYMAMTTQPNVAPMRVTDCKMSGKGKARKRTCKTYEQRWTYAIPLEVIYLTPLYNWNPYDLEYKGEANRPLGRTVNMPAVKGGQMRNGGLTKQTAYNGINSRVYYKTPAEFFNGNEVNKDRADTAKGVAGVLDRNGEVRSVVASGTRIYLRNIPGIGTMRTRYPIMPVHVEGSPIWKELDALKDVVLEQKKFLKLYRTPPVNGGSTGPKPTGPPAPKGVTLTMAYTVKNPPGEHTHTVFLSGEEVKSLNAGKAVTVDTTEESGHSHNLVLRQSNPNVTTGAKYYYVTCDGKKVCWDAHGSAMKVVKKL
ncbi:unnamed protein product [Owenia fusiformis]|uniref:Uncharacterized protein n=1 Tax=Owenia fusiformis TaxID=6347 RepID=A0A8J1Y7P9_OWEFU|nr:unnamed protein product [Owenia fusiformis]